MNVAMDAVFILAIFAQALQISRGMAFGSNCLRSPHPYSNCWFYAAYGTNGCQNDEQCGPRSGCCYMGCRKQCVDLCIAMNCPYSCKVVRDCRYGFFSTICEKRAVCESGRFNVAALQANVNACPAPVPLVCPTGQFLTPRKNPTTKCDEFFCGNAKGVCPDPALINCPTGQTRSRRNNPATNCDVYFCENAKACPPLVPIVCQTGQHLKHRRNPTSNCEEFICENAANGCPPLVPRVCQTGQRLKHRRNPTTNCEEFFCECATPSTVVCKAGEKKVDRLNPVTKCIQSTCEPTTAGGGECVSPEILAVITEVLTKCKVDSQCTGGRLCCYRDLGTGGSGFGLCTPTMGEILADAKRCEKPYSTYIGCP